MQGLGAVTEGRRVAPWGISITTQGLAHCTLLKASYLIIHMLPKTRDYRKTELKKTLCRLCLQCQPGVPRRPWARQRGSRGALRVCVWLKAAWRSTARV